jgi:hypothetical protein
MKAKRRKGDGDGVKSKKPTKWHAEKQLQRELTLLYRNSK